MESLHGTGDSYRLIVTRRNASEILLLQNGHGWALPRLEIQQQQRVAEQLASEVGMGWGLEAYCLFVPTLRTSGRIGEAKCAVMESVRHNDKAPAGTYWMPPSVASACGEPGEARAIREARLAARTLSLDSGTSGSVRSPSNRQLPPIECQPDLQPHPPGN